jgi:hypothetical protein
MATTIRTRIYARGEFCQVSIFAKLVCQTVGGQFFLFCQNYMNAKLVRQTIEVALSHPTYGNQTCPKSLVVFTELHSLTSS